MDIEQIRARSQTRTSRTAFRRASALATSCSSPARRPSIREGELVGVGDFDAQAEQTFRNLERVLQAGGSGLDRIVKVTIFLTDMANFPKIVELRGRWFSEPYPADTIVEVSSLALPELEIEIEAIAASRRLGLRGGAATRPHR